MHIRIARFSLLIMPERPMWTNAIDGQYGLAITDWYRAPWQWGLRISLLLGHKRPFARVTTYSCPMLGSADTVKTLDCVLPATKRTPQPPSRSALTRWLHL